MSLKPLSAPFHPAAPAAGRTSPQNPVMAAPKLGAEEKAVLADALRMKADLGDDVWPGFGRADIPVIIYDDDYEYLFGETEPAAPWEAVAGDDFLGRPYYRRPAKDPQSFAVSIGKRWAGRLTAISRMNKKIPFKIGTDWYCLGLLHEMFHAYQAEKAPASFAAALAVYALEDRYPFKDADFAASWNAEGAALSLALKAADVPGAASAAREFLRIRDARREKAALGRDLIAFEQQLEWLEGLAKYVEIRADELAVSRSTQEVYARFRGGLHFLVRADFFRLEGQLGRQDGDLRFYLSGMALARLLDRLDPGWQPKAFKEKAELEDILRAAMRNRLGGNP